MSLRAIARRLEMCRNTVCRYARAATWEEMTSGRWQNLSSILDPALAEYLIHPGGSGFRHPPRLLNHRSRVLAMGAA
ncbi:hypothetical protein [Streptomyces sp. NPDC002790]|uniref:hypothetical protein n=1 Tax=Streptomyces sp. NPDC002790 TaxID=3154431 RepID=UPI00332FFBFC